MQLIYLSPVPWTSFAQRPQKFVRWFHEVTGGDVLWVEPYPSRFPSLYDLKKLRVSDLTERDTSESWLTVVNPSALPIEPLPGSGIINGYLMWKNSLSAIKAFSRKQETLLVIGKPTVLALKVLSLLKDTKSIYDAMDDFPSFYEGISKKAMSRREIAITKQVTRLIVSSTDLKKKWETLRPDLTVIPNALDAEILPKIETQKTAVSKTVIGYVGTIGAWFDWTWVIELAKARHSDLIRIIGPVYNQPKQLLPDNIELLPACSHNEAVSAMLHFDVAIIPFLQNRLTKSVDPIKYYEFKALGLPIISTGFGEMIYRKNESGVYLCDDHELLYSSVESALKYEANLAELEEFKITNSWSSRFSKMDITY
ncbi:glycosyl transferase [Pseudomonas sp. YL-218 TE3947]|jgi:hypothetical protein|uniref:glycosyl transferase n=1 Tax=Pseudomonas TaxID=286 RepID=UPI003D204E9F